MSACPFKMQQLDADDALTHIKVSVVKNKYPKIRKGNCPCIRISKTQTLKPSVASKP